MAMKITRTRQVTADFTVTIEDEVIAELEAGDKY